MLAGMAEQTTQCYPGSSLHQALLRAVVRHYERDARILAVSVFGSVGRGDWHPLSDLDLDVVVTNEAEIDVLGELSLLGEACAPSGGRLALMMPTRADPGDIVLECLIQLSVRYRRLADTNPNIGSGLRVLGGRLTQREVEQAARVNRRPAVPPSPVRTTRREGRHRHRWRTRDRAVALGFAREGAKVAIADQRTALADETAHDIAEAGGEALAVAVDVTDLDGQDRLVAATPERFGRIDALHNDAGIAGGAGDYFGYTEADRDRVLNVNLTSAFCLTQKMARVMVGRGEGGRILNTASVAAFLAGARPTVLYDVSKAGLRRMTVSLASFLGQYGITVNATAPGTIDSQRSAGLMSEEQWHAFRQRRREQTPLGRLGEPEDFVGASIFLCSDEAAYVTGHTLVVDGGLLTRRCFTLARTKGGPR